MYHPEQGLLSPPGMLAAEWCVTPNGTAPQPADPLALQIGCPILSEQQSRYPTRWRGASTLEELLTDPQVRKVAFAKARSLGYLDQDAEDCFQLGSINLWQALEAQPTLLCDKGAAWVGVWIAFSGSRRTLWKHKTRNIPFDEGLTVSQKTRPERWATWATRIDEQLDFAILMKTLALRYDNHPLKLLALYSLTTSVLMKDVLPLARVQKNQFIQVRHEVKNDLRILLEKDTEADVSCEFWSDYVQKGVDLACVTRVAEQVMDNQRLLLALYIVTTSVKRKDVTALFGIGLTAFRKEIIQIKLMLAQELRSAKHHPSTSYHQ